MEIATNMLLPILTIFLIPTLSHSFQDDFIFGGCTQQKYTHGSPYESNLNSLLTSLLNSATYFSHNNYTIMGSTPQDVVHGLFQCRGDLSMPDCATCVARAVRRVGGLCSGNAGGSIQLEGCYVKYDNVTFLGVEDKSVVFKKCGPSIGYDTDVITLRDAVLGGLVKGGGPFRVGGSGEVRGLAQCVGDLSLGQCQDCVSEAIGKVKSECNRGVYGDMFLAKCYARYSTGAHVSTNHNKNNNTKSTKVGEKTVVIIVGLLAGLALLIIFLVFIRKCFGVSGK